LREQRKECSGEKSSAESGLNFEMPAHTPTKAKRKKRKQEQSYIRGAEKIAVVESLSKGRGLKEGRGGKGGEHGVRRWGKSGPRVVNRPNPKEHVGNPVLFKVHAKEKGERREHDPFREQPGEPI